MPKDIEQKIYIKSLYHCARHYWAIVYAQCMVMRIVCLFLFFYADILLNVFLAIAVDNLADADSLTAIEKEEGEVAAEVIRSSILFLVKIMSPLK